MSAQEEKNEHMQEKRADSDSRTISDQRMGFANQAIRETQVSNGLQTTSEQEKRMNSKDQGILGTQVSYVEQITSEQEK